MAPQFPGNVQGLRGIPLGGSMNPSERTPVSCAASVLASLKPANTPPTAKRMPEQADRKSEANLIPHSAAWSNRRSNWIEALPHRMRVPRQHRLDAMSDDLDQVGVIDAGSPKVGDVAVAALVGRMSRPEACWVGLQRSR